MTDTQLIVALIFLIVLSIFDFLTFNKKKGYIPSVLTTAFLIVMLILGGTTALYLGAVASMVALLFTDLDMWGGIADFKIFVATGMAFSTILLMLSFGAIVTVVALGVKALIFFKITKKKEWNFPFIPVMLIAYAIILLLRIII